jgi:hypothetical protein
MLATSSDLLEPIYGFLVCFLVLGFSHNMGYSCSNTRQQWRFDLTERYADEAASITQTIRNGGTKIKIA